MSIHKKTVVDILVSENTSASGLFGLRDVLTSVVSRRQSDDAILRRAHRVGRKGTVPKSQRRDIDTRLECR
jgi:hypothetical protein